MRTFAIVPNCQSLTVEKQYYVEITDIISPLTKDLALTRMSTVRDRLIAIAHVTESKVIDPVNYLCGNVICGLYNEDGEFIYKD